jgi:hypothetical protein
MSDETNGNNVPQRAAWAGNEDFEVVEIECGDFHEPRPLPPDRVAYHRARQERYRQFLEEQRKSAQEPPQDEAKD